MKWLFLIISYTTPFLLYAQEHRSEQNDTSTTDSSIHSLHQFLKGGKFFEHARSFTMFTVNQKDLTDYGAWGLGAGIGYESAKFKGLQFAVSGFFINNTLSSDLTKRDPQTQTLSRYELSLFDITDPENKNDLDRLEELYLKYHFKKSAVTYGKQYLNTPYINQQDGRMRPTMEKGLWLEVNEIKNIKLQAGWINRMSPRSTVKWYDIGNSIGLYSVGINEEGTASGFKGNLQTKGIAVFNAQWQHQQFVKIQFWNYWVENIFNTAMIQTDAAIPFNKKSGRQLLLGLQFTRQNKSGNGGNEDITKAYVRPGYKSYSISSRAGIKLNTTTLLANYTRITAHGRYLFPREWGRDPFYTFLPRERNEGLGNVHAFVFSAQYQPKAKNWQVLIAGGWYDVPPVTDYKLNKYSMPSYYQLLTDLRYQFKGFLKGTSMRFIYLYKGNLEKEVVQQRNIINKVNMHHFNFIIDYWFGKE